MSSEIDRITTESQMRIQLMKRKAIILELITQEGCCDQKGRVSNYFFAGLSCGGKVSCFCALSSFSRSMANFHTLSWLSFGSAINFFIVSFFMLPV